MLDKNLVSRQRVTTATSTEQLKYFSPTMRVLRSFNSVLQYHPFIRPGSSRPVTPLPSYQLHRHLQIGSTPSTTLSSINGQFASSNVTDLFEAQSPGTRPSTSLEPSRRNLMDLRCEIRGHRRALFASFCFPVRVAEPLYSARNPCWRKRKG